MAYMHKGTFDISQYVNSSVNTPDNYFDIDDLIALPIQVLNRKGYITTGCCAGHPFDILVESDKPDAKQYYPEEANEKAVFYEGYPCYSYILFKEGISLPTLPPGFAIEDRQNELSISMFYGYYADNGVYRRVHDILETMENLYEWASNLSDFRGGD